MRTCLAACAVVWGLLLAGSSAIAVAADLTAAQATDYLTRQDLVRKGSVWVHTEEAKLAENLLALPQLEKKCRDSLLKFEELTKNNKLGMPQLKKAIDEYEQIQKLLKTPNLTPQQQNNLAVENDKRVMLIQQLQKSTIDLRMQTVNPTFLVVSQELSAARHELVKALLQVQKAITALEDRYQAIKDDAEIKAALAVFGPGTRLGPLKPYAKELPKVAAAEKLVFGEILPLYRIGTSIVFDAYVNDSQLLPLGYRTTSEYAIIQTNILEAAGVKIPADAQTIGLQVDGAQYPCKLVKVPKIRVGKYILEDVDVLASPPAAKFLGPWLGTKSFTSYEVHEEVDDCRFTIRPLNAAGDKRPTAITPGRPIVKPVKP